MKINWQAYLDDSMNPEARKQAEEALENDPKARRELDGLELFVQTVRAQALQEEVPYDRLAALIPKSTTKPSRTRAWWPRFELAGMAACLVLASLFVVPAWLSSRPAEIATRDPIVASRWASEKLAMSIPVLDLGGKAKIVRVHEGRGRCCFDYEIDGEVYHLNVRPKGTMQFRSGTAIELATGQRASVSNGVRWSQGPYDLSLNGPDAETERELAERASKIILQNA